MIKNKESMDSQAPCIDIEQAKLYIYSIDFNQIIDKMIKTDGWLIDETEEVSRQYRNFLFLNKKYAAEYEGLAPSKDIDNFWHNHILDTAKYRLDCRNIFGKYFDHYPYLGMDQKSNEQDALQALELTQSLYFKEFGEYIYEVKEDKLLHAARKIKSWLVKRPVSRISEGVGAFN